MLPFSCTWKPLFKVAGKFFHDLPFGCTTYSIKNIGISIYFFENPYWILQTRLQTHLQFTINAVLDWWPLRKCATRVSTWNANFSFIIDAESAKQFSKVHSLNFYQKISTIQTITETDISFNVPSKDITLTLTLKEKKYNEICTKFAFTLCNIFGCAHQMDGGYTRAWARTWALCQRHCLYCQRLVL